MLLINRLISILALAQATVASLQIVCISIFQIVDIISLTPIGPRSDLDCRWYKSAYPGTWRRYHASSQKHRGDSFLILRCLLRNHRGRFHLLLDWREQARRQCISVYQLLLQHSMYPAILYPINPMIDSHRTWWNGPLSASSCRDKAVETLDRTGLLNGPRSSTTRRPPRM